MARSTSRRHKNSRKGNIRSNLSGYQKKKATFFAKGVCTRFDKRTDSNVTNGVSATEFQDSAVSSKRIIRYHSSYLADLAVKTPANEFSTPGADGVDGEAMILRPVPESTEEASLQDDSINTRKTGTGEHNIVEGNMLIEKSRLLAGINSFFKKHSEESVCADINIDMVDIRPWGLFSSVMFTCKTCGLSSQRSKLYEEVHTTKPGRKAAAGNIRLALLNEDVGIGPTEVQLLFAAVGIHANLNNLQKRAVKVSDITEKLARRDMEKWLQHACDILQARGVSSPEQISAQFDVLYHAVNRSNSHCPGQAAAAATALCVETVTPQRKIIEYEHNCKLCLRGARLRGVNVPAICGHNSSKNHHKCTATIPPGQVIREYDMAKEIASRLKTKGTAVTHLTTDSDAKGKEGFSDVNADSPGIPPITWYKDPSHLSRNMRKKISTHSIAGNLFGKRRDGSRWTYPEKMECRKALALDVPKRVSLTLSNMRIYYKGNVQKMMKHVDTITSYMLNCYGGNHNQCMSSPLAKLTGCSGPSQGRCWFGRSHTLRAQGIICLNLTEANQKFLRSVIGMKLSKESLGFVARGETSSRCEPSNRAINKSYPKNRKFSRVGGGRVASAVLRVNNGLQQSTAMKFHAMLVPLPAGSPGAIVIRKYQHKLNLTKINQSTQKAKDRKHQLIAQKAARYFNERTKDTNRTDYMKYQLDEAREANNQALENVLSNDPSTSSTLERDLHRASSIVQHMQETLEHSYTKSEQTIAKKRLITRKRKATNQETSFKKAATRAGQSRACRDHDYHYY